MSLRLRLALWSGGLIALAMLLVGMLAYAIHTRNLYAEVDFMLKNAAEHAAEEYLADPASDQIATASPEIAILAYDPSGKVVASSASAGALPSIDPRGELPASGALFDPIVGLAPPFTATNAGSGSFGLETGKGGIRWRLYGLRVDDAKAPLFLAAAPLDRVDGFVESFRRLVAILVAAGVAIAASASWLVADRTLRPVVVLTQTAAAITHSRGFDRRARVESRRDELGRLAGTFNDMLASLEQAYEAQQRFVSDASHELRAPLTAIQANLELLKRRPDMSAGEREEAVEEATREAGRLTRLVADLLALARADAGVPLRRQRVELDRVLLESLGEVRHLARGQKIEVEGLEPAVVEGDPDRLKQLLLVLLDNAIKYTPPTGQVFLTLGGNGRSAEIAVRDTGVGIPTEELPRVFERFYRADPARSRDPGGTGLGLPIAKWIAQQHGGDVILISEPGRGTTAVVRLPIAG